MRTPSEVSLYALRLGDDALVLCQQLGLWCTRAPEIEEELALANISLDLVGQARALLGRAGDEDDLAYLRNSDEFVNLLLVEQPNGDFAQTIARQLLFSTFQLARYEALIGCADETLAGVAGRGVKEVAYHRDHARKWTLRLGDRTTESRTRTQHALNRLWPFTHEMFLGDELDSRVGVDPAGLHVSWLTYVRDVLEQATLTVPPEAGSHPGGGRNGRHTPHLHALLEDMQSLHRALPGASW